jgi:2-C-methyl-D-erythritol 4-phosphate cytidylyltransferase
MRAVELFTKREEVSQILVAVDPDAVDEFKIKWSDKLGFLGVKIVAGGRAERWETVQNALAAVGDDVTHVAVHDAARPVTDAAAIKRAFDAAREFAAAVLAVRASDTIKRAEAGATSPTKDDDPLDAILGDAGKETVEAYKVLQTVPRDDLWLIQTPQVFEAGLLRRAYQQIADGKIDPAAITDDAGLVEALDEPVYLVEGDPLNVKITEPSDLSFARVVLDMRSGRATSSEGGSQRKFPTWAEMDDE